METQEYNKEHKVIIVGGGPAGLTAAIYAGRANLNPLVASGEVEGSQMPGGQLMITTEVENYPGFPEGIEGPELMERMTKQAERFGAKIVQEWATDFLLPSGGPFHVKVGNVWYETGAVILANGASARWLGAPDEDKFKNKGISACATCDGPLPIFRNKHLFVIGGGDSAVEEATFLTRFASKVTLVHRRDTLRASKIMQDKAKSNPKIEIMWNSVVVGYLGEEKLTGIVIQDVNTGEKKEYEAGGVFMAIGHDPLTRFITSSGVDFDEKGYIKAKDLIHTNIDGVFTAGDIHDHEYR